MNRYKMNIFLIICSIITFIIGLYWNYNSTTIVETDLYSCKCHCENFNKKEEQEEIDFSKKLKDDRRLKLAYESECVMKEQQEYCSFPFIEFQARLKNSPTQNQKESASDDPFPKEWLEIQD